MTAKKILILGVTASGKSRLSFAIAKKLNTDIISIDSMKVYRRMDVGTAKPSAQRRSEVKYHLIDVVEPSESFGVDKFLELTSQATEQIQTQNKPILCAGGTAMYIKALLYGIFDGPGTSTEIREKLRKRIETDSLAELHKQLKYIDPEAAERIHPNDEKRIIRALEVYELTGKPISSFQQQFDAPMQDGWTIIGVRRDKQAESQRINARVKKMMETGFVDEVKSLLTEEKPLSQQAKCAIGYAEIIDYLDGKMTLEEATEKIKVNTRRLAKAQRTWFKRFETVNWIDINNAADIDDAQQRVMEIIG